MKPLGTQIIAEFIYCSKNILNDKEALERELKVGIERCGLGLKSLSGYKFDPVGVTIIAIISQSHVGIHTYPEARHASIDIFTCSTDNSQTQKLLQFLKNKLKPRTVRVIEVLRGNPLEIKDKDWITSFSGARRGFEIRYHIKKRLLSKKTKYQRIDIIDNEDFGRMLFLDKEIQIGEKGAHIYNSCLTSPIIETKKSLGKVAILGGGDGGVLNELLIYNPKIIFLVDMDSEVVEASRKYLKGICKNAFSDPRVRIVTDDANKFLEKNHGFDVIIYDLTMHPEAITNMDRVEFFNQMFSKIKKSLNEEGMITLQCCSEFDTATLRLLKKLLPKYFKNINFKTGFIPPYCENWIFASAEVK